MALKEIALSTATLKINPASIGGTATITTAASTVELANSLGIYTGTITVQVTGTTQGNCVQNTPAIGTIVPTSVNLASGGAPIRKGDISAIITINGTDSSGGPPVPCSYTCTVEIDDPGQTDVLSD